MTYQIIYSPKTLKQLEKLDRQVRERIIYTLERVREHPDNYISQLVGRPGYKFRVGDYRVLLDVNRTEKIIKVRKVGHRSNVYDELE